MNVQLAQYPSHQAEDQWHAQHWKSISRCDAWWQRLGMHQREKQDRKRHDEAGDRPGNADVEQIFAAADRRANTDHGAEGPNQRWKWNEEGKCRQHAAATTKHVVPHLVRKENAQQAGSERYTELQPMPIA